MSDQPFIVYTKGTCPWCDRAKELLTARDLVFQVVELEHLPNQVRFKALHGHLPKLTVPQIWQGQDHIGGYQDLVKHLGVAPE